MLLGRLETWMAAVAGRSAGGLQALLLLSVLVVACGPEPRGEGAFPSVDFAVDTRALAAPDTLNLALVIRRPVDWIPLPSQAFDDARHATARDSAATVRLELLRAFRSEAGAALMVSIVRAGPTLDEIAGTDFQLSLAVSFRSSDIARGMFRVNNSDVVQFRIVRPDMVVFRLFVEAGGRLYQVDYLLPTATYAASVREVESSIGSLTSVER